MDDTIKYRKEVSRLRFKIKLSTSDKEKAKLQDQIDANKEIIQSILLKRSI